VIALAVRLPGGRLRARTLRLTVLVLASALLRAVLAPFGDGFSTLVFAMALIGMVRIEPDASGGEARWGRVASIGAGLCLGLALVAPLLGGNPSGRTLNGLWQWGAIAAVVGTLEEVVIRGRLQQRLTQELGPLAAILAGAVVFALIHLPRYGLSAMPLDFSVGVALGGLRAVTGRVMPGAIAHVMADWGAWFAA
jgi:membrane protease YdiL (CAAX protease family)